MIILRILIIMITMTIITIIIDQSKTKLIIGVTNLKVSIQSLRNKKLQLTTYATIEKPDIICLTETWVTESDNLTEFQLPDYNLFHYCRSKKKGGGVFIFVKNCYNVIVPNFFQKDSELETVWIEINTKVDKILLGAIYRPPNSTLKITEKIYKQLSKILNDYKGKIVFLGDFNFPNIDWVLRSSSVGIENKFIELLDNHFINQHVNKPTRFNNILDLVLSNHLVNITNIDIGENVSTSDHNIVRFELEINNVKIQKTNKKKLNFAKANFSRMNPLLRNNFQGNWNDSIINTELHPHNRWEYFRKCIVNAQNQCVPLENVNNKRKKPLWWSNQINVLFREKKESYLKYCKSRSKRDFDKYKIIRNKLNT